MTGLSEFDLIDSLLKPLAADAPGAFGLSDDAAVLPELGPGEAHVVTKDALAIGVHMLPDDPPADMARKALRVNLSDLAAMGAAPVCFFMALSLGQDTDEAFLRVFASGLAADSGLFSAPLMGGDIIRTDGPFTVSITMVGVTDRKQVLRRTGAKPGDFLWVSGSVGDAALGLLAETGKLTGMAADYQQTLRARFRLPQPRLELGQSLRGVAHACIDISDGLVADVGHICETSGVGCRIEVEKLPLSDAAKAALAADETIIEAILTGGDDYELAFAVSPDNEDAIRALSEALGVRITKVGSFREEPKVTVVDGEGNELAVARTGYQHI